LPGSRHDFSNWPDPALYDFWTNFFQQEVLTQKWHFKGIVSRIWGMPNDGLVQLELKFKLFGIKFILLIIFLLLQGMTDPDDIYRQEKMRELGKEPDDVDPMDLGLTGGNTDATSGGGGGDGRRGSGEENSSKSRDGNGGKKLGSLEERVKLYLQKVNSKSVSSSVSGSNTAINLPSNSNESQKNVSSTIRKIRVRMLDAPGLNGGTCSISSAIEQAGPSGGLWGDAFLTKKDYWRKAIVYLSFDPTTGQCGTCNNDQGAVDVGGGGEWWGAGQQSFFCG
jgi:hypothetical protein